MRFPAAFRGSLACESLNLRFGAAIEVEVAFTAQVVFRILAVLRLAWMWLGSAALQLQPRSPFRNGQVYEWFPEFFP